MLWVVRDILTKKNVTPSGQIIRHIMIISSNASAVGLCKVIACYDFVALTLVYSNCYNVFNCNCYHSVCSNCYHSVILYVLTATILYVLTATILYVLTATIL